jgi:site-specific DNA-methyltransferase (adenine-specific)
VKPYYEHGGVTIFHGDCREILPGIEADVLVTDPPYGINYRTPPSPGRPKSGAALAGDAGPFDPSHLLRFRRAVLFGANHYAERLPSSPGWIVWDKREGMPSNDQSDAELAWTNVLGSVRTIRVRWNGGGSLLAENGPARAIHPTQKPLRLMVAVVALVSEPGALVPDPYTGTGTTLVAAKDLGRRAIGIEIEEHYCEIAAKRLSQEVLPLTAPTEAA